MEFVTAQHQPLLAVLAILCLLLLGYWVTRRRRRQRLLLRHSNALATLQALRTAPAGMTAQPRSQADQAGDRPSAAALPAVVARYTGLNRSHEQLTGRLTALFGNERRPLDAAMKDACEAILLTSDLGVQQTDRVLAALSEQASLVGNALSAEEVRVLVRAELLRVLEPLDVAGPSLSLGPERPAVWLFVGVNGVGKTTTIGKLAHALAVAGHRPVLAAGDTYRAAAAEQLAIWAERSGGRLVRGAEGADPASIAFEAMAAAKQGNHDVVLLDTAGRLHTDEGLMQEIKKVRRALAKQRAEAPDETWLVVDATTGQNALQQAKAFHAALGLTGIILTKLDGSAKGGIVVAIAEAIGVPVRFVGLGEQVTDLQPFAAQPFVEALI